MQLTPPAERIVWSRPPDMPAIEILDVENCQRLWTVFHQTYTICTVTDHGGLTEWTYRGRHHTLYSKHVMLMEPGEIHRNIKHTARGSFHVVHINPLFMDAVAREDGTKGPLHLKVAQVSTPPLFEAFSRFHLAMIEGQSLLERECRLINCIKRVLTSHGECRPRVEPMPSTAKLRLARDYLHEHFSDNVALPALARIAGLSQFHFLRAFSQEFGRPPHAYQNLLRVNRVQSLLKLGVPVSEIDAGFADQSHLIRHFKRVFGVTPGHYAGMLGSRGRA